MHTRYDHTVGMTDIQGSAADLVMNASWKHEKVFWGHYCNVFILPEQVMQIYHMDAAAFHFVSHPNAWVMHRPHPNSAGYNRSFTGEAYSTNHKPTDHMMKMEKIAHGMMDELKVGTYPDVGVTQLAACREKWSGGKDTSKPKLVWW